MFRAGAVAAIGAAVITAAVLRAAPQEAQEEALDPRVLAYDKGPATINVSKYPSDVQKKYKLFAAKCGKCHTLARAINCEFASEEEWERYVKRMMRKAGSFISPDEGKQIFDFVVYDSKVRKKDLYERKTAEGTRPGSGR